jgi:two-component system, OmpR family, response regulator
VARIAVVDDEPDICGMLVEYLGRAGHDMVAAGDAHGLEALLAAGPIPDLFILDLGLPGQDGFALARMLRERYDPGIVILTGAGDLVDRVVGLEIGADDYIRKPVELPELAARIAAVPRAAGRPPPARASAPSSSTCATSACSTPRAASSISRRWRSTSSPPSPPTPAGSSPATS